LISHRRVMDLGLRILKKYLNFRLSQDLEANAKTGFLLESELSEIESGGAGAVKAQLRSAPSVSSLRVNLSRDDNVLSNAPVTGEFAIVPLGYPEGFEITATFENPALSLQG